MLPADNGPERLMAGLLEPVSSKVTLSPEANATRFVPSNQLTPLPTAHRLAVPSPCQSKLDGWVSGETSTLTVLVKALPAATTRKLKLARPTKFAVGVKTAACPFVDSATTPLLALFTV